MINSLEKQNLSHHTSHSGITLMPHTLYAQNKLTSDTTTQFGLLRYDLVTSPNTQVPSSSSMPKSLIKVAAYIRVSTDTPNQENSYEIQEQYFNALLETHIGWTSAGIYADYGISGTCNEKRIGFKRLIRHCTQGKIDRIICKSISRFARNTTDFLMALRTLSEHNVAVFFEKENIDTSDSTSEFILTVLGAIAQEESQNISSNINLGNRIRFQCGEVRNYDIYGYQYTGKLITTNSGFQYKEVEIVLDKAKIVQRIFSEVAQGIPYADIAKKLNLEHIPTPETVITLQRKKNAKKGQLKSHLDEGWTARHISQIIHSERYAGNVLIQKTFTQDYLTHRTVPNRGEVAQFYVQNHHPRIVDDPLYEKIQSINKINSKLYTKWTGPKNVYPFSGRLICKECGRFYHVRNTRSHPIWYCPSTALRNGRYICHAQKVYEEQIIRVFRKALLKRYQLTVQPIQDDITTDDIMSGRFYDKFDGFNLSASDFIVQMYTRLENAQSFDFLERDRTFYKRQIVKINNVIEHQQKRLAQFIEKSVSSNMSYLPQENIPNTCLSSEHDYDIKLLQEQIQFNKRKILQLEEKLDYLENYWEQLEIDFECRKHTIQWMKKLPTGTDGVIAFLNGITGEYCKAFVFSITIFNPFHYLVHWFDDTTTQVQMDSNIEDHRYTASHFTLKTNFFPI